MVYFYLLKFIMMRYIFVVKKKSTWWEFTILFGISDLYKDLSAFPSENFAFCSHQHLKQFSIEFVSHSRETSPGAGCRAWQALLRDLGQERVLRSLEEAGRSGDREETRQGGAGGVGKWVGPSGLRRENGEKTWRGPLISSIFYLSSIFLV